MPSPSEALQRTRAPAYIIAAVMVLVPLMEIGASAWPYSPADPEWRIAVVSAGASASTAILLGLLIIYTIGTLFDDRRAIWLVAWISALMTAFCVTAAGSFILDALQLRGRVSLGNESRYKVSSALALAKICLAGFAALFIAASAFGTGRNSRRAALRQAKRPSSLIVGSMSTAEPDEPVA